MAPKKQLLNAVQRNLKDGVQQYKYLMTLLPPPDNFAKSYENNKLITAKSDDWISGFYPGTLLYLYKATGDTVLKNEAQRIMLSLAKEQYNTTNHDVGFMMYNSFGNLYKADPKPEYKQILINSAKSLSTRFNAKVGSIKSWDSKDPSDFLVIIDNMMNLELLCWATRATGDSSYYKIAVTHANTAMKNHFRPDYSSFHLVNYNPETGKVKQKKTVQGFADSSSWARGQAWGLYGFTMMYRETGDQKYLEQANRIASYILNHPHLPEDKIPYWDYHASNIPNAYRDASAAAIMASALIELSGYNKDDLSKKQFIAAERILLTFSGDEYKARPGTNGGFLLKHSVGHFPAKSQIDVPLSYADYYFVEAMLRYNKTLEFRK
ncbi:glycoside hydrolase family 88 protein [Lacibacter sediminis]|nr:glycoside hydrolase family 88 protein [Lacibacter sediminis]